MQHGIRWRLAIEGRPGWFVPAVSGVFPAKVERGAVKERLTRLLRSYYGPEAEDVLVLTEVTPKPAAAAA